MVRWQRVSSPGSREGQTGKETQDTNSSTGRVLAPRQLLVEHLLPFVFLLLNPGGVKIRDSLARSSSVCTENSPLVTRGHKHFRELGGKDG